MLLQSLIIAFISILKLIFTFFRFSSSFAVDVRISSNYFIYPSSFLNMPFKYFVLFHIEIG